jgi:AcrR family transcriptional regulator
MPDRKLSDVSHPAESRRWHAGAGRLGEHGGLRVAEFQRTRVLKAALQVASESGSQGMSVTAVVACAGVSRRTFYDLFGDRDECLVAALEELLARMAAVVAPAWEADGEWSRRLCGALVAALRFLADERAAAALVVPYLEGCAPRSPQLRGRVLGLLHDAVDEGRAYSSARQEISPLTAEFVVGGVISVIHGRLRTRPRELTSLAGPLMWMIVLPYLGPVGAAKELTLAEPRRAAPPASVASDPLRRLNMRLTYRTARVLEAIAAAPGTTTSRLAPTRGSQTKARCPSCSRVWPVSA